MVRYQYRGNVLTSRLGELTQTHDIAASILQAGGIVTLLSIAGSRNKKLLRKKTVQPPQQGVPSKHFTSA